MVSAEMDRLERFNSCWRNAAVAAQEQTLARLIGDAQALQMLSAVSEPARGVGTARRAGMSTSDDSCRRRPEDCTAGHGVAGRQSARIIAPWQSAAGEQQGRHGGGVSDVFNGPPEPVENNSAVGQPLFKEYTVAEVPRPARGRWPPGQAVVLVRWSAPGGRATRIRRLKAPGEYKPGALVYTPKPRRI